METPRFIQDIDGVGDIWVGLPWHVPVSISEVMVLSGYHYMLLRDTDHVVLSLFASLVLRGGDWAHRRPRRSTIYNPDIEGCYLSPALCSWRKETRALLLSLYHFNPSSVQTLHISPASEFCITHPSGPYQHSGNSLTLGWLQHRKLASCLPHPRPSPYIASVSTLLTLSASWHHRSQTLLQTFPDFKILTQYDFTFWIWKLQNHL